MILPCSCSRSMIETSTASTYRYGPSFSSDAIKPTTPDLSAQLFWTATSLLESDYEGEYLMAQRLLRRVLDHLELSMNDTYERLEVLFSKMKWTSFPGVQKLLLKGLTLDSTSEPSRELLSRYVHVHVHVRTLSLVRLVFFSVHASCELDGVYIYAVYPASYTSYRCSKLRVKLIPVHFF